MGIQTTPTVQVKDEGTSQGFVQVIDFVGAGVSATVSGNVATVTIGGGGASALSAITNATAGNTIANGDNAQVWQWFVTTASKIAFRITENTAATGSGAVLVQIDTIAGSTAIPLLVKSRNTEVIRVAPFSTQLLAANGSVLGPVYSFASDEDSGIYSAGADQIGIAVGGAVAILINNLQKVGVNQSTISARYHVTETTLGNAVYRYDSVATNDDPQVIGYQNRVATTDATETTLHTIATATDKRYLIRTEVVWRRTGGAAGANGDGGASIDYATVKNVGGTVNFSIGSPSQMWQSSESGTVTMTISGTNVLVRVIGAVNNNITWHLVKCEVSELGS